MIPNNSSTASRFDRGYSRTSVRIANSQAEPIDPRRAGLNVLGDKKANQRIDAALATGPTATDRKIEKLETSIEKTQNQISAFRELEIILKKMSCLAQGLNDEASILSNRTVVGKTNDQGQYDDYVKVEPRQNASLMKYNINIKQIALPQIKRIGASLVNNAQTGFSSSSTAIVADPAGPGQLQAGSFLLNSISVEIKTGNSLQDVATAINRVQSQTNVSAQIFQYGSNGTMLKLMAKLRDSNSDIICQDNNGIFNNVSIQELQSSQEAEIIIDSIPCSRFDNVFENIGNGDIKMTLLKANNNASSVEFDVVEDYSSAKSVITDLIETYNDFLRFKARQTATEKNLPLDIAYLYRDDILRELSTQMEQDLRFVTNSLNYTTVKSISDLGLTSTGVEFANIENNTPEVNGIFEKDIKDLNKYDQVFKNNLSDIAHLFQFQFKSSGDRLTAGIRTCMLPVNNFKLVINTGGLPVTTDLTYNTIFDPSKRVAIVFQKENKQIVQYASFKSNPSTTFANGAGTITGLNGTIIQGFTMDYQGNANAGNDYMEVNFTQGIAERLDIHLNQALCSSGTIANRIKTLEEDRGKLMTALTTQENNKAAEDAKKNKKIAASEARIASSERVGKAIRATFNMKA